MYFKVLGWNPQKTVPTRFFFWDPSRDENSDKFLQGKFVA